MSMDQRSAIFLYTILACGGVEAYGAEGAVRHCAEGAVRHGAEGAGWEQVIGGDCWVGTRPF